MSGKSIRHPQVNERQVTRRMPARSLHVSFVCTGNLCRSPMAEQMFSHQLRERGLQAVHVSSAGTGDQYLGQDIDPRAVQVLRSRGYSVAAHRSAQVSDHCLGADLVVAMTRIQLQALACTFGVPDERLRLLRSFDPKVVPSPFWPFGTRDPMTENPDVDDPSRSGDFEQTFAVIEAALPGLHDWLDTALAQRGVRLSR